MGAHMHRRSAAGCRRRVACMRHVLCVVVTEHRGGGCVLLSGIALILLNDYWLRLETEATCVGYKRTDVSTPPSAKHKQTSIYV